MNSKAVLLIGAAMITFAALGPVSTALADGYETRAAPIAKPVRKVVRTRVKVVERPVYVEKIVKQPVYVEHRVEVPVDRPVYFCRVRPVDRIVEKRVEVPVE